MIRLTIPSIEEDDLEAVRESLASGLLIQGPRVKAFEDVVAELVGARHAIAVSNCTCALQLALAALEVGLGDLCVVTAYSWITTANVIELCGARPVFVDIDPCTFNIDLNQLERILSELKSNAETAGRLKAVLPVHTFGQVAEMQKLSELCARWNVPVVEDAACALGATLDGRQAGSWGAMTCFSFHPRKAVTTGEGGMVTTNDDALARRVRALRNHGQDPEAARADFMMPGYNYRLTEFQAALGSTQMAKLSRIVNARRAAAARYDALVEGTALEKPFVMPGAGHVYQSYVTLMPADAALGRARVIAAAKAEGVETQVGTIHMPLTTYYRKKYEYRVGDFPVTDDVASRALTLPLFEAITAEQQGRVVDVILGLVG